MEGNEHNLTHTEAYSLMQLGIESVKAKNTEPEPEPVNTDELTADEKFEKLNAEFQALKQESANKEQQARTRTELDSEIAKVDILKDFQTLHKGAKLQALAIQSSNPKYSIADAMVLVAKDRQEFKAAIDADWEKRLKANNTLTNSMSTTVSGGGGLPNLDMEKVYTPEDVKSGVSRQVMAQFLANQGD